MTRALTVRETGVLRAMITHARESSGRTVSQTAREHLTAQLPLIRAGEKCACRLCPSIELGDDSGPAPETGERWVLLADSEGAGLLLLIDGGKPSYLELFPYSDGAVFNEFPPVSELHFEL